MAAILAGALIWANFVQPLWVSQAIGPWLIVAALLLSFLLAPLALAPLGLLRLMSGRMGHPLQRWLIVAWIAACLAFLGSDLILSLVTRYIYFAVPLVCLAEGALLAGLWSRQAGRVVALALVLLVAWSGVRLWAEGVLMRQNPSVVALSH